MSDPGDSTLARLRYQAEKALERSDRPGTVVAILDRIVELADEGSEPAIFAHRHLAELRLEQHPWRAALHLRKVVAAHPTDDVTHALMGLCQALLGNYRAAISAYHRALQTAPGTPWYHHNLGHLLDVALGEPRRAESYLRRAYQLEPDHDEIVASLAHCLARLEKSDEAETLARRAVRLSPKSSDHRDLLRWIQEGIETPDSSRDGAASRSRDGAASRSRGGAASRDGAASRSRDGAASRSRGGAASRDGAASRSRDGAASRSRGGAASRDRAASRSRGRAASKGGATAGADTSVREATETRADRPDAAGAVRTRFDDLMAQAGFTETQRACAHRLWSDFIAGRKLRIQRPEIYAAAVEYAIALLHRREGATQASIAQRYGVAPASLSSRYSEIRSALSLRPADPRYARGV